MIVAWLAFWAQVLHVPELARLQRVNARRLRSNLLHELRKLVPSAHAVETATGLAALIDGLWLRLLDVENAATARAIVRSYLASQLKDRLKPTHRKTSARIFIERLINFFG